MIITGICIVILIIWASLSCSLSSDKWRQRVNKSHNVQFSLVDRIVFGFLGTFIILGYIALSCIATLIMFSPVILVLYYLLH